MSLRKKLLAIANLAVLVTALAGLVLHGPVLDGAEVAWLLYGAAACASLLAVLLFIAWNSMVGRPIEHLVEGTRRLAEGEHVDLAPEIAGRDEFAALASAIQAMGARVHAVRSDLEHQVGARTRDLRALLAEVHERSRAVERVNRELEEADARKTAFLTNVSHELRTPLNAILGFLSLLRDGMYENPRERDEFLSNAELCARHLLKTVTDVMSAARLEAGRLTVDPVDIHPGDVICEVLGMVELYRREKQVAIRIEADGDTLVRADHTGLRQVLLNLVVNALKFTDEGQVVVRVRPEGERVLFEVEDTGCGIPADELERIFEKFHQVPDPARSHHGGTGLGLAISRELLGLMGGTIHAHSDGPGHGACFRFTLPSVRAGAGEKAAVAARSVESPA